MTDLKLKVLIESNPVKAWCGGKGTGGVAYFSYANSLLETNLAVDSAC